MEAAAWGRAGWRQASSLWPVLQSSKSKQHIKTSLTGTWNISTVSSSIRTLHGIVLPFLRTEDNAGADAELMMADEYCLSVTVTAVRPFH